MKIISEIQVGNTGTLNADKMRIASGGGRFLELEIPGHLAKGDQPLVIELDREDLLEFICRAAPSFGFNYQVKPKNGAKETTRDTRRLVYPENLGGNADFMEAWAAWLKNWEGSNSFEEGLQNTLYRLSEWGPEIATKSIRKAIESGWSGLDKPKE